MKMENENERAGSACGSAGRNRTMEILTPASADDLSPPGEMIAEDPFWWHNPAPLAREAIAQAVPCIRGRRRHREIRSGPHRHRRQPALVSRAADLEGEPLSRWAGVLDGRLLASARRRARELARPRRTRGLSLVRPPLHTR